MGKLLEQLRQIWEKMDKRKRLFLIGGTVLFLVAFSFFVYQISKVEYELLYGNLSQIEQDEIIGSLRASLIYDLPVFLAYLSIIPGMETRAPERTDNSSGFSGSPNLVPMTSSNRARWALTSSSNPSGHCRSFS